MGEFTSLAPARVLDTRDGTGDRLGPLAAGESLDVQIAGRGGVPTTGAAAVVMNVTVTEPAAPGYLSVWPAGGPRPLVSNLNYVTHQTVPNLVTVALGTNGRVSVFSLQGPIHVVFDVSGYYATADGPPGARFHGIEPYRALDTRDWDGALGPGGQMPLCPRGLGGVPVFSEVTAVVLNVTATEATAGSFVTIYPGDVLRPWASNLNVEAGQTVPNLVVARLPASGCVVIYNNAGFVHIVVDIVGYFDRTITAGDGEAGRFVGLQPSRTLDTRESDDPLPPDTYGVLPLAGWNGIAPDASAVVLNVTATEPTHPGYLTVFPDDSCTIPLASNLNFVAGQTVPNHVMIRLSQDAGCAELAGAVDIYNFAGTTHVVVDVFGYFTGP